MECVEAYAFKASFQPEMAVKSTQQALFEDGWVGHGPNGVSGDDCFVDDLFDFSNEDVVEEIVEEEEGEKGCFSFSSQEQAGEDKSNSSSFLVTELSIPADDLANLEWLSHFVEDSFSEFSQPYPAGNPAEKTHNENQNRSEPEVGTASPKTPCFQTPVPGKARSKRSRTSGRVWSRGSFSFDESSSTTSSSSSSSSTSSLIYPNTTQYLDSFYSVARPPAKKQRKKPAIESGETQPQRRCSHCHVQKTPQWRTGPLGAKTLCNACGVRYKSGRLLPEYRPACSPTFATDVHSNNHRKVLEMRRKKEMVGPESVFAPAVHSF